MDIISFNEAATANGRIEKFIENPDSVSGVLTQPSVIQAGETVTVPAGRTAILANTQIDGTLTVDGTVFIPSGATTTDIDTKLSTKVDKVTSTDNAVVRFDGATGAVQNSGVIIDDNNNVGIGVTPSAWRTEAKAVQLGVSGSIESLTNNGSYVSLNANNYNNGSNDVYINTAAGTKYQQLLGTHSWHTAPAGIAGNPITWTNAMTLNATGNLLVGTTTDNGVDKLQVNGSISSGSIQKYGSGDLNNLKYITQTIGTYPSAYVSNTPINDHGYLEIIVYSPNDYVMQRFTTLGIIQTAGIVFVRCLVNGTWGAWAEK